MVVVFSVFLSMEIGETHRGPRWNRDTTVRTGMVHVTGGFSSPSPGVPDPPRTFVGEGGTVSK